MMFEHCRSKYSTVYLPQCCQKKQDIMWRFLSVAVILAFLWDSCSAGPPSSETINDAAKYVRKEASRHGIPIDGGAVKVDLALSLLGIRDVDTSRNEVEIVAWLTEQWIDPNLSWNTRRVFAHSDRVKSVRIEPEAIWMPDISLYNGVTAPELITPDFPIVYSTGNVVHVPGYRLRFQCDLSAVESKEGSNCTLKLGSWTYNSLLLDLGQPSPPDVSAFLANPGFDLQDVFASRHEMTYPCCPEPYMRADFTLKIKKKSTPTFGVSTLD